MCCENINEKNIFFNKLTRSSLIPASASFSDSILIFNPPFSFDTKDINNQTPIDIAIQNGHFEIARILWLIAWESSDMTIDKFINSGHQVIEPYQVRQLVGEKKYEKVSNFKPERNGDIGDGRNLVDRDHHKSTVQKMLLEKKLKTKEGYTVENIEKLRQFNDEEQSSGEYLSAKVAVKKLPSPTMLGVKGSKQAKTKNIAAVSPIIVQQAKPTQPKPSFLKEVPRRQDKETTVTALLSTKVSEKTAPEPKNTLPQSFTAKNSRPSTAWNQKNSQIYNVINSTNNPSSLLSKISEKKKQAEDIMVERRKVNIQNLAKVGPIKVEKSSVHSSLEFDSKVPFRVSKTSQGHKKTQSTNQPRPRSPVVSSRVAPNTTMKIQRQSVVETIADKQPLKFPLSSPRSQIDEPVVVNEVTEEHVYDDKNDDEEDVFITQTTKIQSQIESQSQPRRRSSAWSNMVSSKDNLEKKEPVEITKPYHDEDEKISYIKRISSAKSGRRVSFMDVELPKSRMSERVALEKNEEDESKLNLDLNFSQEILQSLPEQQQKPEPQRKVHHVEAKKTQIISSQNSSIKPQQSRSKSFIIKTKSVKDDTIQDVPWYSNKSSAFNEFLKKNIKSSKVYVSKKSVDDKTNDDKTSKDLEWYEDASKPLHEKLKEIGPPKKMTYERRDFDEINKTKVIHNTGKEIKFEEWLDQKKKDTQTNNSKPQNTLEQKSSLEERKIKAEVEFEKWLKLKRNFSVKKDQDSNDNENKTAHTEEEIDRALKKWSERKAENDKLRKKTLLEEKKALQRGVEWSVQ